MGPEEFAGHWERVSEGYYLKDEAHEGHRSLASLVEILAILSKYLGPSKYSGYHAEHDVLYLGPPFDGQDEMPAISDFDIIRLAELGVHWDTEFDGFAAFC